MKPDILRRICQRSLASSISLAVVATLFAACSTDDTTRSGLFEPHRYDLPQGNYVTREMLDQVKPGASKLDVRRVLGTPLLTDVFLPDRWNYVFRFRHPNGRVDLRRVVVQFNKSERVSQIESDTLPAREAPADPALPGFRPDAYNRS